MLRRAALLLTLVLGVLFAAPAGAEAPAGEGWETVREAPVTFHFRAADDKIADKLAEITPEALRDVTSRTGLPTPRHIDVVLVGDAEGFAAVQPSRPPEWAAGTAWSERSEIYLRTRLPRQGPNPIGQVYVHELVHIVLGRAWVHGHPPRWLNEGLSKYLAGEVRPGDHALLARSAAGGRLLPMESFTRSWPARAGAARLAYVQSVDFVGYLARQGEHVLPEVVTAMAGGASLDDALLAATGMDLAAQEARWSARITIWHALLPIVGSPGFFWGVAVVIFLFAAFKRRREFHRKVAAMEERERLAARMAAQPRELDPGTGPGW